MIQTHRSHLSTASSVDDHAEDEHEVADILLADEIRQIRHATDSEPDESPDDAAAAEEEDEESEEESDVAAAAEANRIEPPLGRSTDGKA